MNEDWVIISPHGNNDIGQVTMCKHVLGVFLVLDNILLNKGLPNPLFVIRI